MRLALLAALSAASFLVPILPGFAAPMLAPHRAVYDLTLSQASERSGISSIEGRMVYEFNGSACEGYTVNFRFVTQIDTRELSQVSDQQTTTYEDGEGSTFSFLTKSYIDQTLDREVRGTANRGESAVTVEIHQPDDIDVTLEPTQFPTQHLLELLDKARAGETFYETTLFDGSDDGDKVMTTTVVIGRPASSAPNDPELPVLEALGEKSFWPVDMAYFDLVGGGGEEMPDYRISFKLYENGLTRDLVMDYGDFSISGRLVDLAMFEAAGEDCAP